MTTPTTETNEEVERLLPKCRPGECHQTEVIVGSVFTIYRCPKCGSEEWL